MAQGRVKLSRASLAEGTLEILKFDHVGSVRGKAWAVRATWQFAKLKRKSKPEFSSKERLEDQPRLDPLTKAQPLILKLL